MNLKKPEECFSLEEIRLQIDTIDQQIISLLSERHKYVEEVVRYKHDEQGVIAAARKNFVIKQRADWAENQGLDPLTIQQIYTVLIDRNIQHELELLKTKAKG